MNTGWECPRCKTIHAPWVPRCTCSVTTTNTITVATTPEEKEIKDILSPDTHWTEVLAKRPLTPDSF